VAHDAVAAGLGSWRSGINDRIAAIRAVGLQTAQWPTVGWDTRICSYSRWISEYAKCSASRMMALSQASANNSPLYRITTARLYHVTFPSIQCRDTATKV
jgi:hypothetical protein